MESGKIAYLNAAERAGRVLLAMAEKAGDNGLKWTMAPTRLQPELLEAVTGFSKGAAGMGTALLHLYLAKKTT